MRIIHYKSVPEYALITDVAIEEVMREAERLIPILQDPENTGGAQNPDGSNKKKNKAVFLQDVYTELGRHSSPADNLIAETIGACRQMELHPESYFSYFRAPAPFTSKINGYRNGDHYTSHVDHARMTILFWAKLQPYSGGELVFDDFGIEIPAEHGTGVIFPSHYLHSVKPVHCQGEGIARVCLTGFLA